MTYRCLSCHHEYSEPPYSRTGKVRCPECGSDRYVWAFFVKGYKREGMKPRTQAEMDADAARGCGTPGCRCTMEEGFYFHQKCHTGAGMQAKYKDGVLSLSCVVCGRPVVDIAVQEGATH